MNTLTIKPANSLIFHFIRILDKLHLIKVLDLEKGQIQILKQEKKLKNPQNKISQLRGKLQLSEQQYKDFHQYINDSCKEWDRIRVLNPFRF
jgi:hypothetical protein